MIYLVGHKKSHKYNSWLAMTNDADEADKLLHELPKATCIKEVETPKENTDESS